MSDDDVPRVLTPSGATGRLDHRTRLTDTLLSVDASGAIAYTDSRDKRVHFVRCTAS